jgi:hypothetical protein
MIAAPGHLLPLLFETAERELRLAGDEMDKAESSRPFEERVARLRNALAAWDALETASSMDPKLLVFLAEEAVSWEAGRDDVRLPITVEAADELIAHVTALRDLATLRDNAATGESA